MAAALRLAAIRHSGGTLCVRSLPVAIRAVFGFGRFLGGRFHIHDGPGGCRAARQIFCSGTGCFLAFAAAAFLLALTLALGEDVTQLEKVGAVSLRS